MVADYVADGAIAESVVRAALTSEATKRGKKESEIRRAINHSLEKGSPGAWYPDQQERDSTVWGDGKRYALTPRATRESPPLKPTRHVTRDVRLTMYVGKTQRRGTGMDFTWGDLAQEAEAGVPMPKEGKDGLPLWGGHELKGDNNHKGRTCIAMHAAFLDYDDEQAFSPAMLKSWWGEYTFVAHTSASHNKEKNGVVCPRGRVIIALSRPVTPEEWPAVAAWLMNGKRGRIGPETAEFDRMYYVPARTEDYWWLENAGGSIDVDAILESGGKEGTPEGDSSHVTEWSEPAWSRLKRRSEGLEPRVELPWPRMNHATGGGLRPGLYVLVGPTGTGKSQWALQWGVHAAQQGVPVMCISLELDEPGMLSRKLSILSGGFVHWSDLYGGCRDSIKYIEESRCQHELMRLPIHSICAPPHKWHSEDLKAEAEKMRGWYPNDTDKDGNEIRGSKPFMIIVDYLQVMGGLRDNDTVRQRVSEAAAAAREIARSYDAIVLMISSTARTKYDALGGAGSGKKGDYAAWIPYESDPRNYIGTGKESGEIEFSCDALFVLVRPKQDASQSPWVYVAIPKMRTRPSSWNGMSFYQGCLYVEPSKEEQDEQQAETRAIIQRMKDASNMTKEERAKRRSEEQTRARRQKQREHVRNTSVDADEDEDFHGS